MTLKKSPAFKRGDLVKEFETVVKQEIASHNKKVQEHQEKLNEFDSYMRGMDEQMGRVFHHLKVDLTELRKELDSVWKIRDEMDEIKRENNKIRDENKRIRKKQNELTCRFLEMFVPRKSFCDHQEHVESLFEEAKIARRDIYETLSSLVTKKQKENVQRCDQIENRIDNLPDIETQIRTDFSSMLNEYKVDSTGVLRVMEKHRKDMFQLQKKFEYLYDEIERLKK